MSEIFNRLKRDISKYRDHISKNEVMQKIYEAYLQYGSIGREMQNELIEHIELVYSRPTESLEDVYDLVFKSDITSLYDPRVYMILTTKVDKRDKQDSSVMVLKYFLTSMLEHSLPLDNKLLSTLREIALDFGTVLTATNPLLDNEKIKRAISNIELNILQIPKVMIDNADILNILSHMSNAKKIMDRYN